jgi:SAM-dependent methyltransferase
MHWSKKPESGQSAQKSRDELQKHWRNSDNPSGYFQGDRRGEYLTSLVKQYAKPDASILELGCNVGSNLYHLWEAGYRNLSGIEINPKALKLMERNFPDMQVAVYEGSIEDRIKKLAEYDLVFTIAVLEHIHRDSEWAFLEIAKRARTLITIEGEKSIASELHIARNYKNIFEGLGLKQVYEKNLSQKEGLNANFYARVFSKNRS